MDTNEKGVVFTPTTANATGRKRVFRHQLAEVHVGLGSSALGSLFYRGGVNDKPSGGDFGSYFADELGELTLSNGVTDFREFRGEVVDLVLTKPLLVHHRDKVAKALCARIVYGTTSLAAFAKLSYHLCKDLGMQFLPHAERLGSALIASLSSDKNRLVQDPSLIKTVFLVLTGWVKVLSPLIKDKTDLLTLLQPLLSTLAHRSSDIGRLAGEAMSIAVRKVTDKAILTSIIEASLDVIRPHIEQVEKSNYKTDALAMDRAVAGVSSLLFECVKGVSGKWHSRFDFFLSAISSLLTSDSNLLHVAVNGMMLNASKHANPASALELTDALVNLTITSLKARERSKSASLLSYVTLLSKRPKIVSTEMVRYLKTFLENNAERLVEAAKGSVADSHDQSIPTCLHAVTSFSLAFAKHTMLAEPLRVVMSEVIELDVPVEVLCENMVQLATLPTFASALRKNAVRAVQKKCETFTPGSEHQLLLLIISIYEESHDTLTPACAKVVMHTLKTEQPQSVKWLAWKLASLLPTASATKVKPAALKVLASDESAIIRSSALRLLHAVKAKETVKLTLAALQADPLSPSIATSGAIIFSDLEPPTEVREPCLAMMRCGKPNVRNCGSKILLRMAADNSHAAAMIDYAQRGENLRADLMAENREKVLCYDRIVSVLKHQKLEEEDLELGTSILFGALNIRFKPLWAKAQEGLQAVAEENMEVFWPLFTKQLDSYEEGRDGAKIRRVKRRMGIEVDDDDNEEDEEDESEASDDESEAEQVSDVMSSIESMWSGVQEDEVSNEDAVTVQSQFKTLWELIEKLPPGLISQYCEVIFTEYEKQCSTDRTFKLKRDEVIIAFLKVLVKQTMPDELSIGKRYRENLWELLTDANTEIQKLALSGLKHFRGLQKLWRYEDKLQTLLPHKGLKNCLLNFDFDSVRSEDVQLATFRILRPKLWQNTNHTRHQVLSFICESNEVQFERFVEHIVVPIINSNSLFNKRAAKILEFLGAALDGLGARIEKWLDVICKCIMSHLSGSYGVTGKGSRAHREARRMCLKLLTKVFKQFPEHKYSDEFIGGLCEVLKAPIADLGNAAASMGSLLTLLAALAEDESLLPVLKRLNALRPLTEVLGEKSVSLDVYVNVLSILDSVIEIDPDMFGECSAAFVKSVHFATQHTFNGNNKAFSATVHTLDIASEHLLKYADQHEDGAAILNSLMSFLIDCLRNRKLKPPNDAVTTCTNVLCSILPKLPNIRHLELVSRMALLFYVIRHDLARQKVALALQGIVDSITDLPQEETQFLQATAELICSTNAMLPDGKYDFDTRISAFYKCAEHFEAWGKKKKKKGDKTSKDDAKAEDDEDEAEIEDEADEGVTVTHSSDKSINFGKMQLSALRPMLILPLAYNLAFFVANAHQSLRTTASLALKSVTFALKRCQVRQGTKEMYEQVICPVIVHGVRVGVKLADPLVRNEWLLVYGTAAKAFAITPGLSNVNTDFDFFANITHPQASRKLKALSTFRQVSKDLSESSMASVFIPYFLKLLQQWSTDKNKEGEEVTQSESGKIQAQSQALLVTFSHIATHLSWSRYQRLVMLLLNQEVTSNHLEKSITGCICKVLECFHFLPTQEIKPNQVEEEDEDEEGKKSDETARIGDILVEKIIPAVHRFWKGGNKKEDGEEKMSLVRAPLAVTILNLLRFIPKDVDFGGVVDSVLTELVSKLKTKKAPQRETVREVLGDALGVLGPSFLKKILHLLRGTLLHGYQLHVMGYTTVTMLARVANCEDATEHIDAALTVTLDTLLDDYIGVGGTEKEVEELAKTMKEVKKNRALEGMELVASLATPDTYLNDIINRVQRMFTPTEKLKKAYRPEEKKFTGKRKAPEDGEDMDVVDTSTSIELLSKVKTMLRRCARGVCRNKLSSTDGLIDFSSDTILSNSEHRDKFLEKFEVKQSSMKVRLAASSLTENITKIRAAQKKDHEVQKDPERRDRGFEKREVTSQKRQLGSARRKGVQESKRRIVIPGAAARRTLQSMECIDELVVSVAWNLVNKAEERTEETMVKVSRLIDPLIEVMGGDAADSVVTLSLLVLHEVLKSVKVKTEEATVGDLMDLAFKVVERQGEIRSACFRLMSVLLLHRQAALNESEAMVCCSLIRTDLDKKNTFVIPALHLLKAIVVKKVEVAEVYDLVPVVQEKMLHHSASIIVSQLSGSIIARFLTDWKMTEKKLHSHIDYVIQNLQYPVPAGRLALLGLLEVMLQRFPDTLLKKEVEYFFIPLAQRLMADEDRAVKRRTAGVLGTLFKLAKESLDNIIKILTTWLGGEAPLQITALQVLNVFLKEVPELSGPKVSCFFPEILLDLTAPVSLEHGGSGAGARRRKVYRYHKQHWEIPYYATLAVEAILTNHGEVVKGCGEEVFERLWDNAHANLTHSHPWVRTAASRIFGNESVQSVQVKRGKVITAARSFVQQLNDLAKSEKQTEDEVATGQGGDLETDVDSTLITMAIKNLTWLLPRIAAHQDHAKGQKDLAGILREVKVAAFAGKEAEVGTFKGMSPQAFFKVFGSVRSGAVVKLVGVLLVKMFGEEVVEEVVPVSGEKKPKGSRARKASKALKRKHAGADKEDEDDEDEEEDLQQPEADPVFEQINALLTFTQACNTIPLEGSPLRKLAKEVLDVLKHSLTSQRFVKLFHKQTGLWKEIHIMSQARKSFKAASKGRAIVQKTAPKETKMLPTTDGSTAKPGSRKRAFSGAPPQKKKVVKRRKK